MVQIFKLSMNVRILAIGISVSIFTVVSFYYQASVLNQFRRALPFFES
jgi:hypothetical protein